MVQIEAAFFQRTSRKRIVGGDQYDSAMRHDPGKLPLIAAEQRWTYQDDNNVRASHQLVVTNAEANVKVAGDCPLSVGANGHRSCQGANKLLQLGVVFVLGCGTGVNEDVRWPVEHLLNVRSHGSTRCAPRLASCRAISVSRASAMSVPSNQHRRWVGAIFCPSTSIENATPTALAADRTDLRNWRNAACLARSSEPVVVTSRARENAIIPSSPIDSASSAKRPRCLGGQVIGQALNHVLNL